MTTAPPPDGPQDRPGPSGPSDEEIERRFRELTAGLGASAGSGSEDAGERHPRERALGPRDQLEADAADDDDSWVPPEPEPVEIHDPRRLLAALLVVAPVLVAVLTAVMGHQLRPLTIGALGGSVLVGVVWSVTLLPRERDTDDPGAVV